MKPLIGITAGIHQELPNRDWIYNTNAYFQAVQQAGGMPVLLPFVTTEFEADELLNRLDGLLLSGGDDVDPQLYGEDPHPKNGYISPERDITEILLARAALRVDMPILGICRGHQLLAVATGGSLVQDIPIQVVGALKHAQEAPRWYPTHRVTSPSGSLLASLLGTDFKVNSYHHQAVKRIPDGFVASAVAPDGTNEAMEHPGYRFVLSVQWHPENFVGRPTNFDPLFDAFVSACTKGQ